MCTYILCIIVFSSEVHIVFLCMIILSSVFLWLQDIIHVNAFKLMAQSNSPPLSQDKPQEHIDQLTMPLLLFSYSDSSTHRRK